MTDLLELNNIITILNQGGLILYPTDTVWGLGCDPFNPSAIQKINLLKKRDPEKKLILLVDSIIHLKRYVPHIHPRIETLLYYHTHPLTVIYSKPIGLPDHLIAQDKTVAIRVTNNFFCKELIKRYDRPLVSTSANISGDPFPKNRGEIDVRIIRGVNYMVSEDFQTEKDPSPSVIVKYDRKGELIFLRE
jgi:L-threonylcarbamoyladenylate synthase